MKGFQKFLVTNLSFIFINLFCLAQDEPYCKNLGFELGDFTNWVGYTWIYSTDVSYINTSKAEGIVSRRQTIIADTTAYDANTGNALRMVPSGFNYSARLGDEINESDNNPRCWEQSLRYTMTIDSSNALLILRFACVLQYGSDHTAKVEPRFRLTLYNDKGIEIPDCSNYDVYASNSYVKGFKTYTPPGSNSPVKWRDWTAVGANLIKYYGQTITVEFMAADCTGKYHFGYAYFVAECHPLSITVNYCAGDSTARLDAPEGFESYSWTNGSGTVVDTTQILKVQDPNHGEIYTCNMISATGCKVSLQSTIAKYIPHSDFSYKMIDCNSNKVQFTNLSTKTNGTLKYIWDFGDGGVSTFRNPLYKFVTSGLHPVKLIVLNPPSTCTDTLNRIVESFSPPLVGIDGDSTYCPNMSTWLKAYGAYDYTWNTGSKADSIQAGAPGGSYWLVGHSSTGCISDTNLITVTQQPDWNFISASDTGFCEGDSSLLQVSGAAQYLWSTGDTLSYIYTDSAAIYYVTGSDIRGCKKSLTFQVTKYPLPWVDFSVSTHTVNSKHNQLFCSIPAETGVNYLWDMGDNSNETGSAAMHTYTISNDSLLFKVKLIATSSNNCTDSSFELIDVVPFVPNVFSPNADGVNDLFMEDIDLEIYDRNGILIYKGNEGWDGKHYGKDLEPDTYFYVIHYQNRFQQIQTQKGFITLVR
jgi:gliding motility-associated-like protein